MLPYPQIWNGRNEQQTSLTGVRLGVGQQKIRLVVMYLDVETLTPGQIFMYVSVIGKLCTSFHLLSYVQELRMS